MATRTKGHKAMKKLVLLFSLLTIPVLCVSPEQQEKPVQPAPQAPWFSTVLYKSPLRKGWGYADSYSEIVFVNQDFAEATPMDETIEISGNDLAACLDLLTEKHSKSRKQRFLEIPACKKIFERLEMGSAQNYGKADVLVCIKFPQNQRVVLRLQRGIFNVQEETRNEYGVILSTVNHPIPRLTCTLYQSSKTLPAPIVGLLKAAVVPVQGPNWLKRIFLGWLAVLGGSILLVLLIED